MAANWKFSDLGRLIKESFQAVMRGEFLTRLNASKYFIHIIWTFFLFFCMIGITMMVEKTLIKVEDNSKVLNDMEIYHAQKTVEIVSLGRMTTIEQILQENGSKLAMPETPPRTIK